MNFKGPIFVVGCSRSGTTLLQSLIATNKDLFAFPEAGLLFKVADDMELRRYGREFVEPKRASRLRLKGHLNRYGLTRKFNWQNDLQQLPSALRGEVLRKKLGREIFISRIFSQFESIINNISCGKRWVEKSPQNIFVLDYIEKYFPNACFIHVVRSKTANIASLIDASRKYQSFSTRFGGPEGLYRAIQYYNNALSWSVSRRKSAKHLILRYESVAEDVDTNLRAIEGFLSLTKDSLKPVYDISKITKKSEVWKKNNKEVYKSPDKSKITFSGEELRTISTLAFEPDIWFPISNHAAV